MVCDIMHIEKVCYCGVDFCFFGFSLDFSTKNSYNIISLYYVSSQDRSAFSNIADLAALLI